MTQVVKPSSVRTSVLTPQVIKVRRNRLELLEVLPDQPQPQESCLAAVLLELASCFAQPGSAGQEVIISGVEESFRTLVGNPGQGHEFNQLGHLGSGEFQSNPPVAERPEEKQPDQKQTGSQQDANSCSRSEKRTR